MAILGQDAMEDGIAFYTEQIEGFERNAVEFEQRAAQCRARAQEFRVKRAEIEATIARVKRDAQVRYGQYMPTNKVRIPETGPDQGAG